MDTKSGSAVSSSEALHPVNPSLFLVDILLVPTGQRSGQRFCRCMYKVVRMQNVEIPLFVDRLRLGLVAEQEDEDKLGRRGRAANLHWNRITPDGADKKSTSQTDKQKEW